MCGCRDLIVRLIDSQLEAADRRRAEEHLLICNDCAAFHADLLRWRGLIVGLKPVKAPQELAPAVMARLAAERRWLGPADSWLDRRRPAEAASLAVALCFVWLLIVLPVGGLIRPNVGLFRETPPAGVKTAGGVLERNLSSLVDGLDSIFGGGR